MQLWQKHQVRWSKRLKRIRPRKSRYRTQRRVLHVQLRQSRVRQNEHPGFRDDLQKQARNHDRAIAHERPNAAAERIQGNQPQNDGGNLAAIEQTRLAGKQDEQHQHDHHAQNGRGMERPFQLSRKRWIHAHVQDEKGHKLAQQRGKALQEAGAGGMFGGIGLHAGNYSKKPPPDFPRYNPPWRKTAKPQVRASHIIDVVFG